MMETTAGALDGRSNLPYRLSQVISYILHPFLVPVYAVLLLMSGDSILALSPQRVRIFLLSVVVLNAFIVPSLFIAFLRTTGFLSSLSLQTRQDRTIPLAIVAICYGICIYMVSDLFFGFMVRKYLIAAFGCAVLALMVNFFWKISLHLIAAGGITAMLVMFALVGIDSSYWPLIICVLLSGLLASARLYLGRHDPWQITAGFFGGFAVAFAAMLFF